ncbi:helicase C-terminal domain-containing protein, partial [Salmonella enterica]|uniref:helicase C-terminal domain-containing protein n=1 Tax=Salmonella enterica TaxID=28901 RepID=UPI003F1D48A8
LGVDQFYEFHMHFALITLKQGVGRLFLDADDRWVLVFCDNRLLMRPYGDTFLSSLPPAPLKLDIELAVRFLYIPSSELFVTEYVNMR